MENVLIYLGVGYLTLAFIKFMLCVGDIPIIIGVMSRLRGAPRGKIRPVELISIPTSMVIATLFGWVPALLSEGIRFFVSYPKYTVIKSCVAAFRNTHAAD